VAAAREAGTLDLGVETVPVDGFELLDDRVIRTDPRSGATTHLLRLELARRLRPMSLERVLGLAGSRRDGLPMLNRRSGKAALRVRARSLMSDEGLPIARYELIRPLKREHVVCDLFEETSWAPADEPVFRAAWLGEVREAESALRRETVHLATGLLLPVWDMLADEFGQVVRIAAADGRTLLGREVPASALAELGAKLGLDIEMDLPPDELAQTVLRTGRPLAVPAPEPLVLKRSLVNGSRRLELTGFSPERLPWYKAQGCFTEIIRYQTRLFVPVDRAAAVLTAVLLRDLADRGAASGAQWSRESQVPDWVRGEGAGDG
jgi:hypothetical protein